MSDQTTTGPADELRGDDALARIALPTGPLPDPTTAPLADIDVSDSRLYQQDLWRPYFERLRRDDPVHYTEDSMFGPYWSITKFKDIMQVESNYILHSRARVDRLHIVQ